MNRQWGVAAVMSLHWQERQARGRVPVAVDPGRQLDSPAGLELIVIMASPRGPTRHCDGTGGVGGAGGFGRFPWCRAPVGTIIAAQPMEQRRDSQC